VLEVFNNDLEKVIEVEKRETELIEKVELLDVVEKRYISKYSKSKKSKLYDIGSFKNSKVNAIKLKKISEVLVRNRLGLLSDINTIKAINKIVNMKGI
jgi:hypothetical protein